MRCLVEFRDIALRIYNHQMHIQRFLRMRLDSPYHRLAYRDVGHENPVHHVDMEPIGLAAVESLDRMLQIAEIGRKQGGRKIKIHNSLF